MPNTRAKSLALPALAIASEVFIASEFKHTEIQKSSTLIKLPYTLCGMSSLRDRVRAAVEACGKSPAEIARNIGKTPSSLSQILSGDTKTLSAEMALGLEAETGFSARWLATEKGPKLTGVYVSDPVVSGMGVAEPPAGYTASLRPILAWEHEEDLPAGDFVMVPQLDVHLSAGDGREQVEVETARGKPIAFQTDWVRAKRLKPARLAAMKAAGRSMEPIIHDGDLLVVDTSQTNVVDGRVYALWYEGGERVKRLFRLPGGGLRISSDNPDFLPIEIGPEHAGHVRIIGQIVHKQGGGGL